MSSDKKIRLAISGTYSTGKSTTTHALAFATGFTRTHALTSRELLPTLYPGKTVEELSAAELMTLGLRRLEERIHAEAAQAESFISDGSVIHEWIYGEARLRAGVNPSANVLRKTINQLTVLPFRHFYRQYMYAYGTIVKQRAKRIYDVFIHLPVEFDMKMDNHRPVSEPFRLLSDELLIETLEELNIPFYVVKGSIKERLETIIELFNLDLVMPLEEAIEMAIKQVQHESKILEEDARQHSDLRKQSWRKRLGYALRY